MIYLLFGFQLFVVLALIVVLYFLLRPIITGAVYLPTTPDRVEVVLALAELKPGEKAADLGSGDGRMLVAFAKAGARVKGYEINPWLVHKSRRLIRQAGVTDRAAVVWRSFWRDSLAQFDVIYVYSIPYIMTRLEKKLLKELKPGARVISNAFDFPTLPLIKKEDGIKVYIKK